MKRLEVVVKIKTLMVLICVANPERSEEETTGLGAVDMPKPLAD